MFGAIGSTLWNSIIRPPTKYQTKTLGSSVTVVGNVASMAFNNLVAGKTYVVSCTGSVVDASGEDPSFQITNTDNSIILLGGVDQSVTGSVNTYFSYKSAPFVAPSNGTLNLYKRNATGQIAAGLTMTLEEVQNYTPVSDWT